jgi:hypothetical protein
MNLKHFPVLLLCFISFSCHRAILNKELATIKERASKEFSAQIDEFDQYKDRPESDGPLNTKDFLLENVPLFLSSNEKINKVYNYRWWMISKHLKEYDDPFDQKKYWVVTEFFGVKPWATLSGAIPCPAGHQFYDVRWLRDPKFLTGYADYYMRGSASRLPQRENANFLTYLSRPESHHFSSWMIDGVESFLKVHPNKSWLNDILPHLEQHQMVWDSLFTVKNPAAKTNGMYKILDLYDGMEFSLSAVLGLIESKGAYDIYTKDTWKEYYLGWGTTANAAKTPNAEKYTRAFRNGYPDFYLVRPSVNAYGYANLKSLENLYQLNSNFSKSRHYSSLANSIQKQTLNVLWNKEDAFFNTLSAGDNAYGIQDFEARVRESVGYTPWYFNMVPKEDSEKYNLAWEMLSSEKGFNNRKGMTTAERQHPYYNEQAFAWNGRGWPFQNSIVYKGYANYLRNYKNNISEADKMVLHEQIEKLTAMHGSKEPNIGEWYIPSDGETFGGEKDYFHSTYPDIIIEDLLGFKASHDNTFSLQPLLAKGKWDYVYLGNLRYHDRDIDILWKKNGRTAIWVDNKLKKISKKQKTKVHLN